MSTRSEECFQCEGFGRILKETPDGDVVDEPCTTCQSNGRRFVDTRDSGLSDLALYDEWN